MAMSVKIVILGEGKFKTRTLALKDFYLLAIMSVFSSDLTTLIMCLARVGKTSLMMRYIKNEFSQD